MPFFNSTNEFLEEFNLSESSEYFDPIYLNDQKVGFSIKRKYPSNIRYKPALYKNGEPDDVAVIWVNYTHPEETDIEIDERDVPIVVRVSSFSQYRAKKIDYDFTDENSPTKKSVEDHIKTPKPVSLTFTKEFRYNHSEEVFLDEKGQNITGIELLNMVFESHCNTIHWLKGLKIQFKLFSRAKIVSLTSVLISLSKYLLKGLFGRTLDEDDMITAYYHGYKHSQFKKLDQDSISIFNYKTSKSVIILFCIILSTLSVFMYNAGKTWGYFKYIGKNNTLSVAHVFLLLWLLDSIIPTMIFWVINNLIKFRIYASHMAFKHK